VVLVVAAMVGRNKCVGRVIGRNVLELLLCGSYHALISKVYYYRNSHSSSTRVPRYLVTNYCLLFFVMNLNQQMFSFEIFLFGGTLGSVFTNCT